MRTFFNILVFILSIGLLVPAILLMASMQSKPGDGLYSLRASFETMLFGQTAYHTDQ